jgi:tetratricopeptide (TPR) repeat protein
MKPHPFVLEIKRTLPERSWPSVIYAARHDPLVWESWNGDLGRRALAQRSARPEDYSPTTLALLALGFSSTGEALRAAPMPPVAERLRQRAGKAWAEFRPEMPLTLAQAGLLALHLRERRREAGSWEGLSGELNQVPATVLACLYGMLADPVNMLQAALAGGAHGQTLVLKALLSQPLSPESQAENLNALLDNLPAAERLSLLRQLAAQRPDLAAGLAHRLVEGSALPGDVPSGAGELDQLAQRLQAAETYRLAAQPAQAIPALGEALKSTRSLQARLLASLAQATAQTGDLQSSLAAWKQAHQTEPEDPAYIAGLALALYQARQPGEALGWLEANLGANGQEPSPLILLALATIKAAAPETREAARQEARRAFATATTTPDGLDLGFYADLSYLCASLDLPQEAALAAQTVLESCPNDADLIALLARSQRERAEYTQAAQSAHLAVALAPDRLELRRLLAEALEASGDWVTALDERTALLERLAAPNGPGVLPADLHAQSACALRAGQFERAAQTASQALEINPNDGLACALLGEAKANLGDREAALEHLARATQLTPQFSTPWLALAHILSRSGQNERALETLQSATQAAPDRPEVYLALGEACLAEKQPTPALAALRRANSLAAQPPSLASREVDDILPVELSGASLAARIELRLGQTLHQLGHLEEARQALEAAFATMPSHPETAYSYAQVLLAMGKRGEALAPLEAYLQTAPLDAAPYVEYGQCLLAQGDPASAGRSLAPLRRALEIDPEDPEARALLAEALNATGDYLPAMEAYRQALETDLAQNPAWRTRLSLGLGQTAIKLGQMERAVAALQDASQADPLNPVIQRSLSQAYDELGFTEDAYQAARTALSLAPNDLENLAWFANQAVELQTRPGGRLPQAQTEATQALECAIQIAPYRSDLLVRLSRIQMAGGDTQAAHDTLARLCGAEAIDLPAGPGTSADLYEAAQSLLQLGDAQAAVSCLKRALKALPAASDPAAPSMLSLLDRLAAAQYQAGDIEAALEAMDQAITLAPQEAGLYLKKADLLLEMKCQAEALACLETALELKPDNPPLHRRAAQLHRAAGELSAALAHAEKVINMPGGMPTAADELAARALAADLARSLLHNERAWKILDQRQPVASLHEEANSASPDYIYCTLEYTCLHAELALELDKGDLAAADLGAVLELDPTHPRLLALQARLAARHAGCGEMSDPYSSLSTFQAAVDAVNTGEEQPESLAGDPFAHVAALRAVAEAAIELRRWDTALQLLGKAAELAPQEPLSQLGLARALTLRAEYQDICQVLEVVRRSPGEAALSGVAQEAYLNAIHEAARLVNRSAGWESWSQVKLDNQPALGAVARWRARGGAVFAPSAETAQVFGGFARTPTDVAALVACLRRSGNASEAGLAARANPRHPLVLAQLALALAEEKPRQALSAAQAAVRACEDKEVSPDEGENAPATHIKPASETLDAPLYSALLARLVANSGNSQEVLTRALEALHTALEAWPDEPRWHALAARLCLARSGPIDMANAVSHLEQATSLEPKYAPHFVSLGRIYYAEGSLERAVQVFEQASQLAPEEAETWLCLARAQRGTGDLEQAANCAERAVTLSPQQCEPLLLRGEIALETGNPRGAQSRAQAALRIQPDDPAGLFLLARALEALNQPGEALVSLEKALSLTDHPLEMLILRARLLTRIQGQAVGLQALAELSERYPEDPAVLSLMAEAQEESGQYEEAVKTAQRALQNMPTYNVMGARSKGINSPSANPTGLHRLLGRLLRRAGQLDQAIQHLSEAIRLDPGQVEPYLELGGTQLERRQNAQALQTFKKAITVAPQDPRPYYQAGLVLKESKDYLTAENMLRRAVSLDPNDLTTQRLLAAVVALNLVHNRRQPAANP